MDAREVVDAYAAETMDLYGRGQYGRESLVPLAFDALRAVLALHQPREYVIPGVWQCGHCDDLCHSYSGVQCEAPDAPWPCPTVRAISDALAGEVRDGRE